MLNICTQANLLPSEFLGSYANTFNTAAPNGNGTQSQYQPFEKDEIDDIVRRKFVYVVTAQIFGKQRAKNDER